MRGKIRKREKKEGRIIPGYILPALAVFLLAGASVLTYFLDFSCNSTKISPPYEEFYSASTELRDSIRKIDKGIYEALYRSEIPERDVFFLEVQPRHQNGYLWEVTKLLVRCPDYSSTSDLLKKIKAEMIMLNPQPTLRVQKDGEDKLICQIIMNRFLTHKIVLDSASDRGIPKQVRPLVAIIVDDLGYDARMDCSFMESGLPLTFSVLPSAPFTDLVVREANKKRLELMAHLPMEPKNYPEIKPGPGALLLSMGEKDTLRALGKALDQIPGARGANNHMGSSFTENRDHMKVVLNGLREKGLFFVDSRTSESTVGMHLASEIGLPAAGRDVFLDNDLNHTSIEMQLERFLNLARHSGNAVGIVHPHAETLQVLNKYVPRIKEEFEAVPVSKLVSRQPVGVQ